MISDVDLGEMKIEPAAPAGQFQRLDSPCPSCGKHIVIRPKVISVPDVNLKSGVSFLVRKSPRHRPKNWLNQGKPI